MLHCIAHAEPAVMMTGTRGIFAKLLFQKYFKSVKYSISVGSCILGARLSLKTVKKRGSDNFEMAVMGPDDPAAILFTSGSTGPSKGVLYTHKMFAKQVELLRQHYQIKRGETDLPTFPLFGLFGISMGMTSILPKMDFTRPAQVDPQNIIAPVTDFSISNSFGSPALWNTVSRYCISRNIKLPALKRILIAGAPVSGNLLQNLQEIVDSDCKVFTPYGATEALPVASIEKTQILQDTWEQSQKGSGTCIGHAVPGMEIKIIRITDDPLPCWQDDLEQPLGHVGEIIVRGEWVTRQYFNRQDATRLAKIKDGETFWHRMGDVGRLDNEGLLWFYGRKNQRVVTQYETLFTIPCEAIFNAVSGVKRSALVGLGIKGHQSPVIIIEPQDKVAIGSKGERMQLRQQLLQAGAEHEHTQSISKILFHPDFPVDIRHNAKIFREKLALWAERHPHPNE
jgi:acyl-CoA synthetase (AMP-forming)/AMP-acid ligase II